MLLDIDKADFLDDFIEDMRDLTENAHIALNHLETAHDSVSINELFRVAHSIKGMSASMEYKRMEMVTHKLEDLMYALRDNTLEFTVEILETLQLGFAFLNELFESIKFTGDEEEAPCEGLELLIKKIKDILEKKGTHEEKHQDKTIITKNITEGEKLKSIDNLVKINVMLDDKCSFKNVRAFMIINKVIHYGNLLRTIPLEKNISNNNYEMKVSVFSLFLELEHEKFEVVKKDILSIMEVHTVDINYVKDLAVENVIDYNDDLEIDNIAIIKAIGLIELKIIQMEYTQSMPIELNKIKDDLHKLNILVSATSHMEIIQLFGIMEDLIIEIGNKDLRDDNSVLDIILDSFIIIKDTLSNKDEDSVTKDIKLIEKNIQNIEKFISDEKIPSSQALGSILISKGVLKNEDIEDILKIQHEQFPDKKFGEIAMSENKVTSKDIINALKIQNKQTNEKKEEIHELLKVPVAKADHLIDLLEELMMIQSQLEQSIITNLGKNSLTAVTMNTSFRITKEIRNLSISFRMITLRNIFQKVNITVRESLKQLGKTAEIVIFGEETEIDRVVGNKIIDPLLHLIKNSVAHGIESPEERVAKGKRANGIISISARAEKGSIYIEITDDGSGIVPQKIFSTAVKKGLIQSNDKLSEEEIINLIFAPGFSTAEAIDTISGRGVGMDVVKTEIHKLGGRIKIDNRVGNGVTFTLRIPQNMTSLNGTVVDIMNKKYIIPTLYIKEIFSVNEDSYVNIVGKRKFVKLRKNILPIIPIENIFYGEQNPPMMIVLEVDGVQKAFPVNQVMERREIVVKPLSDDFDNIKFISGASILGDGNAALIIGVEQLFKLK